MAQSRFKEMLSNLGFSDKESRVYLALLQIGKGTVSEISRIAEINRTTGYDILNELCGKGLATISGKEPKQEYAAESPDKLDSFFEAESIKLKEKIESAKELVPQLKSIHNFGSRPRVRFFEGTEGLEEVYEDTLTSHETIRAYAAVDDMHKALPKYFPKYYQRRADLGISIRAVLPKTQMSEERSSHDIEEKRDTAFVPSDKFYFSPEINIYDNKVMIASLREKLGIIIESEEIADAMKKIYELAWVEAKRLDKDLRKTPSDEDEGIDSVSRDEEGID